MVPREVTFSAVRLGDIRHGKRIFVDIHADEEGARLATWLTSESVCMPVSDRMRFWCR